MRTKFIIEDENGNELFNFITDNDINFIEFNNCEIADEDYDRIQDLAIIRLQKIN